tara:strand:- start:99 stop:575 length:477 start_codon:yes stop_codon:yes gene_type:complete
MDRIESEFLFSMEGQLDMPFIPVGQTPEGWRIVANLAGGSFSGPSLKGKIARSGGDWGLTRADGSFKLDVRCCLLPDDGSPIYMHYYGRIVMKNHDLMAVLGDPALAATLKPSDYYFRTAPYFEVATDSPHAWLNDTLAVGVGAISATGITYMVYRVL